MRPVEPPIPGAKPNRRKEYDVFLSYSRADDERSLVRGLAEEMRETFARRMGYELRIFQDKREIQPSQMWQRRLEDALQASTVLVPLVTRAYLGSQWCRQEWNHFSAVEKDLLGDQDLRLIFPVLLDGRPQVRHSTSAGQWLEEIAAREYVDLRGAEPGTERHKAEVSRLMDNLMAALHQVNAQGPAAQKDTDVRHFDGFTGYVRDRNRFVRLLAEALNVTIVGITNETLAEMLQRALDIKQERTGDKAEFWRSLRIVFLSDDLLGSINDVLAEVPDRNDALRRRILAARFGRRSVSILLNRIPSSRWELYESRYHLPFAGTLFEMPDESRIVQLVIPRPQRRGPDHLFMEFHDRPDRYFSETFSDITHNSTSLKGIVPVGVPQGNGVFRCTGKRFQDSVLVDGSRESGWLPVVLIITWRHRDGHPELLLQLRTEENSGREVNRISHLTSYVFQDDNIAAGGAAAENISEFDLSQRALAEAARRCVQMDIDMDVPRTLTPVATHGYLYPDKENLFFFVFAVEVRGHPTFLRQAELQHVSTDTLLAVRERQAIRNAIRICKLTRRSRLGSAEAAQIAALNLSLHGHDALGAELVATVRQGSGLDRMAKKIATLNREARMVQASDGRQVEVIGLAGLQYREFFTTILPLYEILGIKGASEALASVRDDEVKRQALGRLAAMYLDEEVMTAVSDEI